MAGWEAGMGQPLCSSGRCAHTTLLVLPALKLYCRYNELEQSNGFLEGWQKSMLNTARRAGAG